MALRFLRVLVASQKALESLAEMRIGLNLEQFSIFSVNCVWSRMSCPHRN